MKGTQSQSSRSFISRDTLEHSRARLFVGQLEPHTTEDDLRLLFSCYGHVLHLNISFHSTTVTPFERRRVPTAFVWFRSTIEADAAIAALHNIFSFSSEHPGENQRYLQVSYAYNSPECTVFGARHQEMLI